MALRVAYDIAFLADVAERNHPITGISRATQEVLARLANRPDLEVRLTGLAGPDPYAAAARVRRYLHRSNLGLAFEPGYRTRVLPPRAHDALADAAQSQGWTSTLARAAAKLSKVVDGSPGLPSGAYDVFHSTFLPLPHRSLTAGAARVLTVYDLIPLRHPEFATSTQRGMLDAILRSLDVRRDVVITISDYVKRELCESIDIDEDRVVVALLAAGDTFRPAAETAVRALRQRLGLGMAPYILSVAASQPHKNLAGVIRAYARYLERHPDSQIGLVLAGTGGDEVVELKRHAHQCHRITRLGFVAEADLATLYSGAAAFIFLSRMEGFGLPPLEAMACGAPVVTSDRASLPEVVGDAAITVDPDDLDAAVDALRSILTDDSQALELRGRGLARASVLTWGRTAAATAAAYRRAAEVGD